eukprot:Colp12_sorted_trinity150504_noHs@25003
MDREQTALFRLVMGLWSFMCFCAKIFQKKKGKHLYKSFDKSKHELVHKKKKILVLDLDETLIHSSLRGYSREYDLKVEVFTDKFACLFYVCKRPHVDYFLSKVAEWYTVIVFTASLREYADPVIDMLDQGKGLISKRYFRESCVQSFGNYIKNLAMIEPDLSNILIVDNSPGAYEHHPENAIPIETWEDNPRDECLLDLLPFLDCLRHTCDVRSILSLRLR